MFVKNDNNFVCKNCGKKVKKLNYTSRDHCNYCLYSVHIDISPGDRKNECLGMLEPINIEMNSKKGEVIIFKCKKCGKIIKNIVAIDDDREEIYKIVEEYSKNIRR